MTKEPHGSTAEETAAVNETFKAFAKKHEEHNETAAGRERIQFRLEVGLAVGVALNIILTGGLLIAGAFQADYSGQQVKASQDQLGVMQDTEQRQLRAYIGVIAGDLENFGVIGKMAVKMVRKNYGLTPAYEVGFSAIGTDIVRTNASFAVSAGICSQPTAKASIAGLITMFPTVELPLTAKFSDLKISDGDLAAIKAGDSQFVYFGDVCYRDTFGKVHYTNYCYIYKGTSMAAKDADGCLIHNDSN
ncbi:MAG: hypothetical protein ABSF87_10190 [Xanthobacteraceae bacterium]|jgi:hypothetical protein